jgi:F0F1-type ATP synthase assembly protein I
MRKATTAMGPDDGGEDDPRAEPARKATSPNWAIAFDLGLRLGISVILGLGGGILLDSWLRTSPIFTLIGMVLGIAAAMYTIWDVARDAMRR